MLRGHKDRKFLCTSFRVELRAAGNLFLSKMT